MTHDEIIEMAEQAGMTQDGNMWFSNGKEDMDVEHKHLVAFANLVFAKALAQRTWVGLTDEDKKQMAKEANYHWEMTAGEYAERIGQLTEAKLKEKNT